MIAAFIILISCASVETESYAEKNGWVEVKPPRPDLQCWRLIGRTDVVACVNSVNSTHGAFDANLED